MSPPLLTGAPLKTWRKAWSAWARLCGLEVAWTNQRENTPQRRMPYVRLQFMNMQPIGTDEQTQVTKNGLVYPAVQGMRQITLGVQVVANATPELEGSAWAWADELTGILQTEEVTELFRQAGLAVIGLNPVVDLSGLEQSEMISRVAFDIVFSGAFYRVNPQVGTWIERIIGEGDLEGNPDPEITFDVQGP